MDGITYTTSKDGTATYAKLNSADTATGQNAGQAFLDGLKSQIATLTVTGTSTDVSFPGVPSQTKYAIKGSQVTLSPVMQDINGNDISKAWHTTQGSISKPYSADSTVNFTYVKGATLSTKTVVANPTSALFTGDNASVLMAGNKPVVTITWSDNHTETVELTDPSQFKVTNDGAKIGDYAFALTTAGINAIISALNTRTAITSGNYQIPTAEDLAGVTGKFTISNNPAHQPKITPNSPITYYYGSGKTLTTADFVNSVKTSLNTDGNISDVTSNLNDTGYNKNADGTYTVILTYIDPVSGETVTANATLKVVASSTSAAESSTASTTASQTASTAASQTASTSTTNSQTASTTQSEQASTTESQTASTTQSEQASTTVSQTASTEVSQQASTTQSEQASTTESQNASTEASQQASTTQSEQASTTESQAASTTQSEQASTTESQTASTEASQQASTTQSEQASTTESQTASTGVSQQASTTQSEQASTTESQTASTTQSEQTSTTESQTASTEVSQQASTTQSEQASTTESQTASTEASQQASTTQSEQASTTESQTASTGVSQQASTTQSEQASTTESQAASTTQSEQASTTESQTASTTQSEQASTTES
ncbi:hypothetical protein [Schleiferilactobacillus perolens]|uniref:Uncharacterized protein n=1 Tax=Schleiferilactobacillus perolens DSM 12744 TaxID=1423792 RepID=A0A0R1MVA0_9LACO|nr:hypothetical protein [Schleiferilactobacillus perolens]KRL08203.1 hypothetical protein FD09_GL001678 [Schleiferilactobacillus perolens DSM 12744]